MLPSLRPDGHLDRQDAATDNPGASTGGSLG